MCNQSGNTAYDGYGVLPNTLWGNRQFHRIVDPVDRLMYIYLRVGPEFSPSGLFHVEPISLAFAACTTVDQIGGRMAKLETIGLLRYDGQTCWLTGVREHFLKTATPEHLERIDADIARVLPTSVQKAYCEEYGIIPSVKIHQDALEAAVAQVIGRSVMLFDWDEKETCRSLTNGGHTAEEVREVFGQPNGLWYLYDWRGRKGQRPTLKDVRVNLEPLLEKRGEERVITYKVDQKALTKMLGGLIRANKGIGFARAEITETFGGPVWEKLRARMTWREWRDSKTADIKWRVAEALK